MSAHTPVRAFGDISNQQVSNVFAPVCESACTFAGYGQRAVCSTRLSCTHKVPPPPPPTSKRKRDTGREILLCVRFYFILRNSVCTHASMYMPPFYQDAEAGCGRGQCDDARSSVRPYAHMNKKIERAFFFFSRSFVYFERYSYPCCVYPAPHPCPSREGHATVNRFNQSFVDRCAVDRIKHGHTSL